MAYENFYEGTVYGMEPGSDSLYTGAKLPASSIGGTTSVQTANQLNEVSNLLNTGMKTMEVSSINADIFDMVPKQHLKEINRLTKLTGAQPTFHAPLLEPSGFSEQGGWSEQNREMVERQLKDTITRAREMSPDANMPITIHASAIPGIERIPINLVKDLTSREREKYSQEGSVPTRLAVVNQETGEIKGVGREIEYYPESGKLIRTPEEGLRSRNYSDWVNKINNLAFYKKEADEVLIPALQLIQPIINKEKITEQDLKQHKEGIEKLQHAEIFLNNIENSFRSLYDNAYKTGDEKTKEVLNVISEQWKKREKEIEEAQRKNPLMVPVIRANRINDSFSMIKPIEHNPPKTYKPVEEFAIDKASETLSNVAFDAYKKFQDKAPIISIENPPYGAAMGTAEDLKKLIEQTRKKFVEKAKSQGLSESEAKKQAAKLIGATWDTSHISMMRKQGFTGDDLIRQAKIIAPYVKHVHLNDNFGYTHTDLPPGMGNVPMKQIVEALKKANPNAKNIFEGGNFFSQFKTSPHAMVLEAMGSPIYSAVAQPSWSQVYGTFAGYGSGYVPFPEQHFSIYGSGFSGLPQELGGQVSSSQSRFSGTPMA